MEAILKILPKNIIRIFHKYVTSISPNWIRWFRIQYRAYISSGNFNNWPMMYFSFSMEAILFLACKNEFYLIPRLSTWVFSTSTSYWSNLTVLSFVTFLVGAHVQIPTLCCSTSIIGQENGHSFEILSSSSGKHWKGGYKQIWIFSGD